MQDIKLLGDYCYGIEIEGGCDVEFTNKKSQRQIDMVKGVDPSAVVSEANNSEIEMRTAGYWKSNQVLEQIDNVINFLDEHDWKFSDSCGIHIHISSADSSNVDMSELVKILKFFYATEDTIFEFLPKSRHSNDYCTRIRNSNNFEGLMDIINNIPPDEIDDIQDRIVFKSLYTKRPIDKHHSIGLDSYFRSKTIEYRMFDANIYKLKYFVDFLDKLMYYCANISGSDLQKEINDSLYLLSLERLLEKLNVSEKTKENLCNNNIQQKAA